MFSLTGGGGKGGEASQEGSKVGKTLDVRDDGGGDSKIQSRRKASQGRMGNVIT